MKRALLVAIVLLAAARFAHADDFFLKEKDTVVFYGDSITAQRLYTTYVEHFVATRCPDLDVRFVHSGWGGDTVRGGGGGPIDKRLERDVIAWKPTVVTIMLGMNDGRYRAFDEGTFEAFEKGYEHIVATLKEKLPGVRLVLIEPSPYDDVTRKPNMQGGYNSVLVKYGEFVRALAKKEGALAVDLNAPVVAALEKANAADADTARKIIADRVHPGAGGHLVMAQALLEAWHAPELVSEIDLDLAQGKVVKAENAAVADVTSLSWTATERALPLPLDTKDPALALVAKTSGVVDALDREVLKVSGLTEPRYELTEEGKPVAVFTKEELEKGVNLALHDTPQLRQSHVVLGATKRRCDLAEIRWRQILVPYEGKKGESLAKALDGLQGLVDEVRDDQRALSKPRAHKYALVAR